MNEQLVKHLVAVCRAREEKFVLDASIQPRPIWAAVPDDQLERIIKVVLREVEHDRG
jgi:hypothetical protein